MNWEECSVFTMHTHTHTNTHTHASMRTHTHTHTNNQGNGCWWRLEWELPRGPKCIRNHLIQITDRCVWTCVCMGVCVCVCACECVRVHSSRWIREVEWVTDKDRNERGGRGRGVKVGGRHKADERTLRWMKAIERRKKREEGERK